MKFEKKHFSRNGNEDSYHALLKADPLECSLVMPPAPAPAIATLPMIAQTEQARLEQIVAAGMEGGCEGVAGGVAGAGLLAAGLLGGLLLGARSTGGSWRWLGLSWRGQSEDTEAVVEDMAAETEEAM